MRWWGSKPQSVTAQSLDSAAFMINTFILAPHPTCLSRFLDRFVSPPPNAPHQWRSSSPHLSFIPAPHLLSWHGTLSTWTSPTPTPRQPPPLNLRPAPRACVYRRVPRRSPPRCCPRPAPRSLSAPGGSPAAGPSASLCPASLPMCCSTSLHLLGLGPLGVLFTQGRGARVPPLPGSRSSQPPPPRYMVTPAPSGSPAPPPPCPRSLPPGRLDPVPVGELVGA